MQYLREVPGLSNPVGVAIGTAATLSAAAATYYLTSKPAPWETGVDMNNQSIKLPDGSRTSVHVPDGKSFIDYIYEDARTTHESFKRGLKISKNGPCLGTRNGPNREYTWLTYSEVYEMAKEFGSGLLDEGLKPNPETIVGIYSINRAEWTVTEQACSMFSIVTCALYDTLGPDTCAFIINQTGMSLVVCDTSDKAQLLLDKAECLNTLKTIVVMDKISENNIAAAKKHGIKLISFRTVMENGKENPKELVPPSPDDLCLICYTSGTTGDPKGAMLTHRSVIANLASICFYVEKSGAKITSGDSSLSYLPLAHVFERGLQVVFFMNGAKVGFSSGDVKLLTDDLQALKPTIFPTVPRLLNRMYDKVMIGVKGSALKSTLFQMALSAKESDLKRRIIRRDSIWDYLVFKKIQDLLGGKVRLVFTASAPLEQKVLNFTRCAFGCVVVEGYGQTENTAGIAFNIPGETEAGHVGPPLPCNIVKLIDVPEMDYYSKNDQGEIVCKGPSVFSGYFKNEEKTKEALDEDGWLHTGDIGQWLPKGVLKIIDRKKNIFKLSQGEYVAAEKIENTYMRSQYVAQAFIEGDSLQPYLMGVMVPDEEVMTQWAKENEVTGSFSEVCDRKDVKDMILADINKIGKAAGLKGFEMVKDIIIHPELFSVENGLLTPTFKNKRPQLRKFFKTQVQELYAKHNPK
ncbi:long-chain-fatty-acid--CoA ligase 1-like isoform X2 [Mercenaria mercenaria]|nr:long-chain-fatty-acid--CoA ligase 1-like isoform X2 [Mercenaria mercenaria]